jgi:hypothetical protein
MKCITISLALVALIVTSCVLSFELGRWLLNMLTPWFHEPAPALTKGELTTICVLLFILGTGWSARR